MTVEYKIYYDNKCAKQEQLKEIEEIVVEQQIGAVWEARIKIPVCVSEEGVWEGEEEATKSEFSRVRIEVRVNEGKFVPLIDGRIVGKDAERSAIPGKSMTTLVVHDDSALLHTKYETEPYQQESDSKIAEAIFEKAFSENTKLSGTIEVDKTPVRPDTDLPILQEGSKMQILRSLASRYEDFYAYVLPGEKAGESIFSFKRLPTKPEKDAPTLYMLGEDRNLAEFNVRENASSASSVTGATLSLRDKSVATSTSSYSNAELLAEKVSTEATGENERLRRLPTGQSDTGDLETATSSAARDSGFTLTADGSVLPLCFNGVLIPYRVVPVRISDSRFSTNYVVFKVIHTLTRSNYTQSFTMKGDSVSASSASYAASPQASANVSVAFNIQVDIF